MNTKSLDQWLEECPNKLEFYSRFIDVKEDIENVIEDNYDDVTDEQKEQVLDLYMRQDWSENNEFIGYLITEVQEGNLWTQRPQFVTGSLTLNSVDICHLKHTKKH